jgi:hypothetical protein
MDASTYTINRRDRILVAFYRTNPTYKRNGISDSSSDIVQQIRRGNVISIESGNNCKSCREESDFHYTVDDAVLLAFDGFLRGVATTNIGPTRCARVSYLWMMTMSGAYNWVSPLLSGTTDNWNWDVRTILPKYTDRVIWITEVLAHIMPIFVSGYSTSLLYHQLLRVFQTNMETLQKEIARVKAVGNWSGWLAAWDTWYAWRRDNDGSIAAALPPATTDLPNGTTVLDVAGTVDPETYPSPTGWTPLKVGVKTQKYLTHGWGTVLSPTLSLADETEILAAGNAEYIPYGPHRDSEIDEVVTISETLTDEQKMIAEFWAGGPNTVSPPGMFMWMWKESARALNIAHTRGLKTFFLSGLDLATHLFETSRLVWSLKWQHKQARPIQEIRRRHYGETLTSWAGGTVQGESWVPYQESNFVTPPFPDFPSGHSGFSQSFANVMTDWFGAAVPTTAPLHCIDLQLLSPSLNAEDTQPFGRFVFSAGSSQIQPSVVPAAPITLEWTTWQEMADSAGISRKYGGIHATSAHVASQALANELHQRICWNFQRL